MSDKTMKIDKTPLLINYRKWVNNSEKNSQDIKNQSIHLPSKTSLYVKIIFIDLFLSLYLALIFWTVHDEGLLKSIYVNCAYLLNGVLTIAVLIFEIRKIYSKNVQTSSFIVGITTFVMLFLIFIVLISLCSWFYFIKNVSCDSRAEWETIGIIGFCTAFAYFISLLVRISWVGNPYTFNLYVLRAVGILFIVCLAFLFVFLLNQLSDQLQYNSIIWFGAAGLICGSAISIVVEYLITKLKNMYLCKSDLRKVTNSLLDSLTMTWDIDKQVSCMKNFLTAGNKSYMCNDVLSGDTFLSDYFQIYLMKYFSILITLESRGILDEDLSSIKFNCLDEFKDNENAVNSKIAKINKGFYDPLWNYEIPYTLLANSKKSDSAKYYVQSITNGLKKQLIIFLRSLNKQLQPWKLPLSFNQ